MKRRMKWKCFMLAVVLLLETCAGNDLQAERKMAADFGMNIKKVYASQQLPNDKKQQSLKKAENTEESVQPAQTVTPSATEPATTEPSETEPAVTGPATTEPSATEPSVTEPATTEPAVTEPAKTATPPATRTPAPSEGAVTASPVPIPTEMVDLEPGRVAKLYFCGRGRHKVTVSWKKTANATSYLVYRKASGQAKYTLRAEVTAHKYLDKSLTFNKKYRYQVVAVNKTDGIRKAAGRTGTYNNRTIVQTDHQKYSYAEMSADIQKLQDKYHGIVHTSVIGKSEDGRNLYDVVIGNTKASKTLLVVANLHAREYMTSELCMDQIEYYLENYYTEREGGSWKKTFDKIAVHYVPMANPDGTTISQFGIKGIRSAALRKRLRKLKSGSTTIWKANARGVDLNRNYPVRFRKQGKRGPMGYSGPKACSESETRAIKKLTDQLRSQKTLRGVISYHAMGSIIFGGSGLGGTLQKNTDRLYYQSRRLTGYASAAGYHSSSGGDGNFLTYIHEVTKVPGITLEVGRYTCPGPAREYPSVWKCNKKVVIQAAKLFR